MFFCLLMLSFNYFSGELKQFFVFQVVYASPEAEAVSDFVCRNNIFLFLYAAVNNFQLDTDDHFFEPTALYQYKDISKARLFALLILGRNCLIFRSFEHCRPCHILQNL